MSRADEIRLITKIARMYYDQGIRQQEITERLNIHQSTISRLLKQARKTNIVRISVAVPPGIFSALEEQLETRFGLKEAIVVDCFDEKDEESVIRALGGAAAFFIETSIKTGMVIGISSWSRALVAMVEALHQTDCGRNGTVVQILGGVGSSKFQYANQLANELAARIGANAVLLQAPAVAGSSVARDAFAADPAVREASQYFKKIDVALVGIGNLEPSSLLARSGNVFSPSERTELSKRGSVGDICLRHFDSHGKLVKSPLMRRVIGIELEVLKSAKRIVGIAGGSRKQAAILAALRGGWINVLITDRITATELVATE